MLAKITPDVAGPAATIPILSVASPIVILGIVGLSHEYHEARKEFNNIVKSEANSRDKLAYLAQNSQKYRDIINKKLGLNVEFDPNLSVQSPKMSTDHLANEIVKYEQLQNDKLIKGLGRKYGWTGAVGLSGMLGGVTATTGYSIAKLASYSSNAVPILSGIASGLFIAGQAAVSVYAGNRTNEGVKELRHLAHKRDNVDKSAILAKDTKDHVKGVLNKESSFIKKTKVSYGISTIAGQALMFTGVVLGLTGFGLAATIPLYAAGTALSVIPGVRRVLNERREEKFKGHEEASNKYVEGIRQKYSPLNLLSQSDVENPKRFVDAAGQIESKLSEVKDKISAAKGLNILYYAVNGRNFKNKTVDEKLEKLEKRVAAVVRNRQSQDAILDGGSDFSKAFNAYKDHIKSFLELPKDQANTLLQNMSQKILEKNDVKADDIIKYLAQPDSSNVSNDRNFSSRNIQKNTQAALNKTKDVLNASRFELSHNLVSLLNVKSMSESIEQELNDYKMLQQRMSPSMDQKSKSTWQNKTSNQKDRQNNVAAVAF